MEPNRFKAYVDEGKGKEYVKLRTTAILGSNVAKYASNIAPFVDYVVGYSKDNRLVNNLYENLLTGKTLCKGVFSKNYVQKLIVDKYSITLVGEGDGIEAFSIFWINMPNEKGDRELTTVLQLLCSSLHTKLTVIWVSIINDWVSKTRTQQQN